MDTVSRHSIALALLLAASQIAYGQFNRLISGKVVMEDGSPLPKSAQIERSCGGRVPVHIATTNAKGEFSWTEAGYMESVGECTWRAVLPGWESTILDMETIQKSGIVPNFVLSRAGDNVPPEAATRWNRAVQAIKERRWADAEADLRPLSSQFPQTGPIWTELGFVLAAQERLPEARQAYRRSIQGAPWYLPAYHQLAVLDLNAGEFPSATATLNDALKKGSSAVLFLDQAEVRYNQHDSRAEYSALQAIALDKKHELPRAEYVLGLILAGGEDKTAAAAHLRRFIETSPDGPEAESARARLRALESNAAQIAEEPLAPETFSTDPDLQPDANGEVGVPGGLRALAAAARIDRTPAPKDFFLEFCRAVTRDARNPGHGDIPDFVQAVQTYLDVVVELSHLSQEKAQSEAGEKGQIVLSTDTVANYAAARDTLRLFGWRPVPKGVPGFEPNELGADSARQLVPMALGIDETEMFRSLADRGASDRDRQRTRAHCGGARVALAARQAAARRLRRSIPPESAIRPGIRGAGLDGRGRRCGGDSRHRTARAHNAVCRSDLLLGRGFRRGERPRGGPWRSRGRTGLAAPGRRQPRRSKGVLPRLARQGPGPAGRLLLGCVARRRGP